jgi:hypothetical protein
VRCSPYSRLSTSEITLRAGPTWTKNDVEITRQGNIVVSSAGFGHRVDS